MLKAMLGLYGTVEVPGSGDNPDILAWAEEVGVADRYKHDETAWCGLAMAVAAKRAGYPADFDPLWALNWLDWGHAAGISAPMLGDVLVFRRTAGGHVGMYVGEDQTHFHVLGGNQGDACNITRFAKATWTKGMSFGFVGARRSPWRFARPPNVRRVFLAPDGAPVGGSVV
jgi:uncharacterized protein (TIGR02594 family)